MWRVGRPNDNDNDTHERAPPASTQMDQWELRSRRKKKYFASDMLNLFKFYEGETNVFPKECVKTPNLRRPGFNTTITAIVESTTRIPDLDKKIDKPTEVGEVNLNLEDSILDSFIANCSADDDGEESVLVSESDSDEEEVVEDSTPATQECSTKEKEQTEAPSATDSDDKVNSVVEVNEEIGAEHPNRKASCLTDRATDTCTAEEIEMSLRKMNEGDSPYVRRCDYERYVRYVDKVFDEYRNQMQELVRWKSTIDGRVSSVENGHTKRVFELEMGQAGVIDEMTRMKLDIADVDARAIMNTRDIKIRKAVPRDRSKPRPAPEEKYESIWDISELKETIVPEVLEEMRMNRASAMQGGMPFRQEGGTPIGAIQVAPPGVKTRQQTTREQQSMGRPISKSTPAMRGNNEKTGEAARQARSGNTDHVRNVMSALPPKPQRGIRESFNMASRANEIKAGRAKETMNNANVSAMPNGSEVPVSPIEQPSNFENSWAEEVSDDEIISCLDDANTTAGGPPDDSSVTHSDGEDGGSTLRGDENEEDDARQPTPMPSGTTRQQNGGSGGLAAKQKDRIADATTNRLDGGNAAKQNVRATGASRNRLDGGNGTRNNGGRTGRNAARKLDVNNGGVKPKVWKKGEAAVNKGSKNTNDKDDSSYAAVTSKYTWDKVPPKKRKRVKSKVGTLSGAHVTPQCDLYVQGIAFSRYDSYEDVEEMMYQFGESRNFCFSFAKAIPVRNDKRQIGCKITVDENDAEILLDDDFWPDEITVRVWSPRPRGGADADNGDNVYDEDQYNR